MIGLLFLLCFFCPSWEFFFSYIDVTSAGTRLQMLSFARNSRSLNSRFFLACHVYCDTWHSFPSFPRTRDINTCRVFDRGTITTCFDDICLSYAELEPWYPACQTDARFTKWTTAEECNMKTILYFLECDPHSLFNIVSIRCM